MAGCARPGLQGGQHCLPVVHELRLCVPNELFGLEQRTDIQFLIVVDVVCLTILTRAPHMWLMLTFYQINNATIITHLFIDSVSVAIPFWALRGRAPVHSKKASAAAVPNKSIVEDLGVKATTSAFAAMLYSFIVFVVSVKVLPEFLITHFDGLKTLEIVHTTTMLSLLTSTMLPLGWCAREFILTPSLAAQKNLADIREETFNPETATLAATLQYNMWGYSKGTKVLLQRILALVAFGWINGSYETFISVAGADWAGAIGYSGIWSLAHLVVGVAFAWVESD